MSFPRTFTITTQPYLDNNQCYKNILTINVVPDGPLQAFVRRLKPTRLSPFQVNNYNNNGNNGNCGCDLVLINPFPNSCSYSYSNNCGKKCDNYMSPNEIPNLYSFLTSNGYQIETQLTNMMNNSEVKLTNSRVVCSATYFGANQPNICYTK
jgi:hypothetical protein